MHRAFLVVAPLLTAGCGDMMITRRIDAGIQITVLAAEGLGPLESKVLTEIPAVVVDLGDQLAEEGINREDIGEARIEDLLIEATDPEGADLSFLSAVSVTFEADGLDPLVVASAESFPEGEALIVPDLADEDLAPYLMAPTLTLTPVFDGHPPEETTTVEMPFTFKVRARAGMLMEQAGTR